MILTLYHRHLVANSGRHSCWLAGWHGIHVAI